MKKLLSIICLLVAPAPAFAACTGSGLVWACPSGASTTDVASAISSASNNAVITFANGTYTWSSNISLSTTKGVTLICAASATCTVNSTGTVLGIQGFSGTLTNLYRISGFTFSTSNTGQAIIWFDACNPGCLGQISQLRVDHNTVTLGSGAATFLFIGDTQSNTYVYGVEDHNNVTSQNAVAIIFWIGQFDSSPPSSPQGQANNFFVEDNTLNVIINNNASVPCFSDAWGFAGLVMRHNTITNCSVPVHDMGHGGGPENVELYNNQFILNSGASGIGISDGYRMFHHQGAQEEMFFNNTFAPLTEPHNGATLSAMADYVDLLCPPTPYPCNGSNPDYGPQPGRSATGVLKPIYGWNNYDTNNTTVVDTASEAATTYIAPNRDLYTAVSVNAQTSPTSPFDGTVGVGFGTLANMPTTCTHSNATFPTLSADGTNGGVGYAAMTTAGTIGASVGEGTASDVVLYHCGATNTWTTWYTPYIYPHPLISGSASVTPAPALGMFARGQASVSGSFTSSIKGKI